MHIISRIKLIVKEIFCKVLRMRGLKWRMCSSWKCLLRMCAATSIFRISIKDDVLGGRAHFMCRLAEAKLVHVVSSVSIYACAGRSKKGAFRVLPVIKLESRLYKAGILMQT